MSEFYAFEYVIILLEKNRGLNKQSNFCRSTVEDICAGGRSRRTLSQNDLGKVKESDRQRSQPIHLCYQLNYLKLFLFKQAALFDIFVVSILMHLNGDQNHKCQYLSRSTTIRCRSMLTKGLLARVDQN